MHLPTHLQSLLDRLRTTDPHSPYKAFVGLDGYVDKIQKVVRAKRPDGNDYFDQISELAGLLHTLAGKSGQIELVTLATKIGGNAPIMAQALASLGISNRCIGTLSDPVFDQMHRGCELVSLGPPAETNALEFGDGKLIFSEVSVFERLRWSFIVGQLGIESIRRQYAESRLVAFVDWANLPHSNELWENYLREIVSQAPADPDRHLFFDLCDPTKRSIGSIQQALMIVAQYAPYGQVTLGMNENEARRIYLAVHGHSPADAQRLAQTPDLPDIARCIREKTNIPTVLIHPIDCSLVATDAGVLTMPGRLVPHPTVLTGGGDNLNAGYCWGLLHGFSLADCLLLGMATSGAYVENGLSPDLAALIAYLDNWRVEIAT
ncbi:hypothetical protein BN8_02491 [Fibrisoma limi BUZ 3]|uniref:Carbohydrate kinase PfkB domain-containing protein n=1 Tax=Fibrisoma limi BUZ 3 TaxID=1185876 RepID=I2GHM4_9BACT|nr:hypothetical protein [Fibrisoma limi]CCH53399.1 hypothetical protein BN8_02491 [Fibrisoma limi BUZ 3]